MHKHSFSSQIQSNKFDENFNLYNKYNVGNPKYEKHTVQPHFDNKTSKYLTYKHEKAYAIHFPPFILLVVTVLF